MPKFEGSTELEKDISKLKELIIGDADSEIQKEMENSPSAVIRFATNWIAIVKTVQKQKACMNTTNRLEIRSDGPPDHTFIGSYDGFQTEFCIEDKLKELQNYKKNV